MEPDSDHHPILLRAIRALRLHDVPPAVRRTIVGVIGMTILIFGIALIVLPGPAFLVIPMGLAVLATEFLWARRWLRKVRSMVATVKSKFSRKPPESPPPPPPGPPGPPGAA